MSKLLARSAVVAGVLTAVSAVAIPSASAHLHPLVPFQCAPEETGAGNESEGLRTAPWAPDSGRFIVQIANPGSAESSNGVVGAFAADGTLPHGAVTAHAHCAATQ